MQFLAGRSAAGKHTGQRQQREKESDRTARHCA
jgi:hypothetical protein